MPIYRYRAIDSAGRRIRGRIDAKNIDDLEIRLKHMRLDLIDGVTNKRQLFFSSRRIPRQELIHFCFHLEMLVHAGIPLLDGLTDLRDTVTPPGVRDVMASLIESIQGGNNLSQAMSAHPQVFDHIFISLIDAGETAGRLPDILKNLTETLKWEDELISQTKKIVIYPAFVATIVLTTTCFLMVYLVPQIKVFVQSMGQSLPLHTRVLFLLSDILVNYGFVIFPIPIAGWLISLSVLNSSQRAREWRDHLKLKTPFTGSILHKIILSRFTRTFALLYSSGIPVVDAIQKTQEVVGNLAIRSRLEQITRSVTDGSNISTAFNAAGLFPPFVIRMMRVGENTGALDEALLNVSYFYSRDVRESVGKAQQLIEPILTTILGCILGWVMLSVLGPFYDVISTLKI